jgi:putative ABC transport system permease protein
MNRMTLISFYRSLMRQKFYAALNIGGLALGIAVFIVLGLYLRFETSYEKWVPNYDKLYSVQSVWKVPGSPFTGAHNATMGGLLDQLNEDLPGLEGTRMLAPEGGAIVRRGSIVQSEDVALVDPNFLEIFELPMAEGAGSPALADVSSVLVSESAAQRLFGSENPLGKTLAVSVFEENEYRVAGVFRDLPENSDFQLSVIAPMPADPERYDSNWYQWGSTTLKTFLRFSDPAAAERFDAAMPAFIDRRARNDFGEGASEMIGIQLLPLADMHLEPEGSASATAKFTLLTLSIVGLLTLLIAVINYINLATAQASLRAREVAMRKVLGADRKKIKRQFLGEAVLTVAVAALLGLVLAELSLPLINAAGGLSLSIPYALVVPALVLLVVVTGILAGAYPALLLARFDPAAVLASNRSPGGGRSGALIREGLVVVQFGFAIAFLIGTAVLVAQTQHVRAADIGFKRENLITVLSLSDGLVEPAQKVAFLREASDLPAVSGATLANTVVGGSGVRNADNVPLPGVAGDGPSLTWEMVGPNFFETYGMRLLAGRWFDSRFGGDDDSNLADGDTYNIVINRAALSALGYASPEDAIGKTIGRDRPRTIVGVVENVGFFGPREEVGAGYYRFTTQPERLENSVASLRFSGDPRDVNQELQNIWQRIVPQVPFEAETADERLAKFYEDDERATRLFALGAGIAVMIGIVGLWGLASFNTSRRVREIGIRKSLGASSIKIVKLLVGQFLRPVLIANLIAWPLAYFTMRVWLAGFSDRIALSPVYFVFATVLAVLIAVGTVFGQAWRASRISPAMALRHD